MTKSYLKSPFSEEPILLHELYHRIVNEFASTIGFISIAARRSGNEEFKLALTSVSDLLHKLVDVYIGLYRCLKTMLALTQQLTFESCAYQSADPSSTI